MSSTLRALFKYRQEGATEADLRSVVAWAGKELPAEYLALLRQTNGAEHCLGKADGDTLVMWSAQEVSELSEGYGVAEFAPGLILIGSNGGGEAIALDTRQSDDPASWPVVHVPFGDLAFDSCRVLAANFKEWIESGFLMPWAETEGS